MNNESLSIKVLNPYDPKADPSPYVEVLDPDEDEAYMIENFVRIVATDENGKDISNNVVYDSSMVDFTKPGDYPVEVSVMDDNFNMVSTTFTIHVLDEREVKLVEAGRPLHRESKKEREERANRRDHIIDAMYYIGIAVLFIGFAVFTYLDAF